MLNLVQYNLGLGAHTVATSQNVATFIHMHRESCELPELNRVQILQCKMYTVQRYHKQREQWSGPKLCELQAMTCELQAMTNTPQYLQVHFDAHLAPQATQKAELPESINIAAHATTTTMI